MTSSAACKTRVGPSWPEDPRTRKPIAGRHTTAARSIAFRPSASCARPSTRGKWRREILAPSPGGALARALADAAQCTPRPAGGRTALASRAKRPDVAPPRHLPLDLDAALGEERHTGLADAKRVPRPLRSDRRLLRPAVLTGGGRMRSRYSLRWTRGPFRPHRPWRGRTCPRHCRRAQRYGGACVARGPVPSLAPLPPL